MPIKSMPSADRNPAKGIDVGIHNDYCCSWLLLFVDPSARNFLAGGVGRVSGECASLAVR